MGTKDAGLDFLLTNCSSVCCKLVLGSWSDRVLDVSKVPVGGGTGLRLVPILLFKSSAVSIRLRMLGLLDLRVALPLPNMALTSWMVTLAWWLLPDFKSILFTEKSSTSPLLLIQMSSLTLDLALL